jgi:hypothetical protein
MALQNRVTPFGEILALPMRGAFMGNRGIIHDPVTRTLTKKRWASPAWIICLCDYKGVKRDVMATRSWTELFFLDEATALAAGHRPCFYCRHADAKKFQAAWAIGNGEENPTARRIDAVLHRERLLGGKKRINSLETQLVNLPDGAMISSEGVPVLLASGKPWTWSYEGYKRADKLRRIDGLLTPPSTLKALMAGYRPVMHATAFASLKDL